MAPALRVMTWNVHYARGLDRRLDLERVAEVIACCDPDVVALQELDAGCRRSRGVDQLALLGERLRMRALFCATKPREGGLYGHGLLSKLAVEESRSHALPGEPGREPRRWMRTRVTHGGAALDVVSTHLSVRPSSRARQAGALAREVLEATVGKGPALVLLGDLNSRPGSGSYQLLSAVLRDACREGAEHAAPTWPAPAPMLRLDHVLLGGPVAARSAHVVRTSATRLASDHLPVVVELELRAA